MPPLRSFKKTWTSGSIITITRDLIGARNMGRRPIETIEAGKDVKEQLTEEAA